MENNTSLVSYKPKTSQKNETSPNSSADNHKEIVKEIAKQIVHRLLKKIKPYKYPFILCIGIIMFNWFYMSEDEGASEDKEQTQNSMVEVIDALTRLILTVSNNKPPTQTQSTLNLAPLQQASLGFIDIMGKSMEMQHIQNERILDNQQKIFEFMGQFHKNSFPLDDMRGYQMTDLKRLRGEAINFWETNKWKESFSNIKHLKKNDINSIKEDYLQKNEKEHKGETEFKPEKAEKILKDLFIDKGREK